MTIFRNHHEKTIEGDLFSAFVTAGAISKANADDPKKSSLVRCARTDKGVHAAGNLISLKLIVEDPDIVPKINEQLSPQIRVWGIERTNGSFSAYQFCDSRIYEYLIPSHCFLPPHPKSFLASQIVELAKEANDLEDYSARQRDVADFWSQTEERYVKPVVEGTDPSIRDLALKLFYEHDSYPGERVRRPVPENEKEHDSEAFRQDEGNGTKKGEDIQEIISNESRPLEAQADANSLLSVEAAEKEPTPLENAVRQLKGAHIKAKRAYRIHPDRLSRIQSSLSRFVGSHQYHNYTINKTFRDPSAARVIKSFTVDKNPIIINDTEWLSLKVHGQSFMMHQIRKMVSMVALLIRCGCHEGRLQDSYTADRFSIPKAPSLGLLLERPVFDIYNEKLEQFGREKIDFSRHEKEMNEFKQREIYERIFKEEERDNTFDKFFTGLDHTKSAQLLYLSSVGIEATKKEIRRAEVQGSTEKVAIQENESEDEGETGVEEG